MGVLQQITNPVTNTKIYRVINKHTKMFRVINKHTFLSPK
jgi:hypothetical protein